MTILRNIVFLVALSSIQLTASAALPADAVEFSYLDREACSATFDIKDPIAVAAFLNDQDLITYLERMPIAGDLDFGCRINIVRTTEHDRNVLKISRQLKPGTIKEAASFDLVRTLFTYVVPDLDYPAKADITGGFRTGKWPEEIELKASWSDVKAKYFPASS